MYFFKINPQNHKKKPKTIVYPETTDRNVEQQS